MPAAGTQKKQAAKRTAIDPPLIDAVRQFNRFYTRQLGLLEKGYLSSRWTLTEARVLYEIARKPNLTAAEIAAHLHLDVAYLSRMLATFERQRLLRRTVSKTDARQRHLALTAKGIAAFQPLNQAAADQVRHMLAPLAASQRTTLLSAMHRVEELLDRRPQLSNPFTLRALQVGDIGWITHRQGLLYAQEYGWDVSYEALVAEILAAFIKDFHPDRSAAWIAETSGPVPGVVGSVFLVPAAASVAKLRLLYVEPSMRGMGLGRRLVDECIAGARARGYRTLTLWTNSVLISARRIYEAVGFQLRAEERHHSFGKDLVGQTWERTL